MSTSILPSLPAVPDTDPSRAVLDSFRIAIAKRLSETLPLTIEQAYAGVDYGKKGEDFTVAVPRFRLPGKIDEIAAKVKEGVSVLPSLLSYHLLDIATVPSRRLHWVHRARQVLSTLPGQHEEHDSRSSKSSRLSDSL